MEISIPVYILRDGDYKINLSKYHDGRVKMSVGTPSDHVVSLLSRKQIEEMRDAITNFLEG